MGLFENVGVSWEIGKYSGDRTYIYGSAIREEWKIMCWTFLCLQTISIIYMIEQNVYFKKTLIVKVLYNLNEKTLQVSSHKQNQKDDKL